MLTNVLRGELQEYVRKCNWRRDLGRVGLLALFVLMVAQFVGSYIFNTYLYLDVGRFTHGYERLPFQTRLLLAPLFRWAETSPLWLNYTSRLAENSYFFAQGLEPDQVMEFFLDIPCVLISGFVAVRIYQAASRRRLLGWMVFPLFLVLCIFAYTVHTVQNFRYVYDLPSMAFFSLGLCIIYFRKSTLLLVALFAVATLNRETTLLLIPFYLLSELARGTEVNETKDRSRRLNHGLSLVSPSAKLPLQGLKEHASRLRSLLRPEVAIPTAAMLAYWAIWHSFVFHMFRHNATEYYPRFQYNLYLFRRLRYYPQLFSACGYLIPFLLLFWRRIADPQLRIWIWMVPVWYCCMSTMGILTETRVFGEMLPVIACSTTLIAEEMIFRAVLQRRNGRTVEDAEEDPRLVEVA